MGKVVGNSIRWAVFAMGNGMACWRWGLLLSSVDMHTYFFNGRNVAWRKGLGVVWAAALGFILHSCGRGCRTGLRSSLNFLERPLCRFAVSAWRFCLT